MHSEPWGTLRLHWAQAPGDPLRSWEGSCRCLGASVILSLQFPTCLTRFAASSSHPLLRGFELSEAVSQRLSLLGLDLPVPRHGQLEPFWWLSLARDAVSISMQTTICSSFGLTKHLRCLTRHTLKRKSVLKSCPLSATLT